MADTVTTTLGLTKPEVGASEDSWGEKINTNFDLVDDALDGTTAVSLDINGGTIDGAVIGGATPAAGTFTTLTANTSLGGTLSTAAQPNVTSVGALTGLTVSGSTSLAGASTSADITFGDNDKAIFGVGSDLQIYHDGSHSYISDQGEGNIYLRSDNGLVVQNAAGTETVAVFAKDDACELFYDNSKKLNTTSTGIDVTGTAVTDGLTVAGNVSVDGGTIKLDGNYPVGSFNVALGDTALDSLSTGQRNTGIGHNALTSVTSGERNTAVGYIALEANTGTNNTAIGEQSFQNNTTGASNTGLGAGSGANTTTGSYNTAIGQAALVSNTAASRNTAVGYEALYSNTTANGQTAVGHWALRSNTSGLLGVAVGYNALTANTTGDYNVATGYTALTSNTTGALNTAYGAYALQANTTASENTAVGYQAGYTSNAEQVTAIGYRAGYVATGIKNTFLGAGAGSAVTTGTRNTIIGRYNGNQGGLDIRTSSNNIVLSDGDGNPRVIVDSSGNLLVGTTDTFVADNTSGNGLSYRAGAGDLSVAASNTPALYANRMGSDGGIMEFRKDGSTVGSIGVNSGDIYIASQGTFSAGLMFEGSSGAQDIRPCSRTGDLLDAAIDLGDPSVRFKDLYLSGGVYLGGTGSANKLEDYEEGTFTPSYTPLTGAFTSITYARQVGTYTKIGRAVYCNLSIATASLNPSGASGNVKITGLPFTPAYNTTIYAAQNNNWASNPPNCGRNLASGIEVGYNDAYNNQFVQVSDMNTATATRNEFNSDFVYYIA